MSRRGTTTVPPASEGRDGRCDEAVHVEERHRDAGDVVWAEPVVRDHRASRRDEVALEERHLLRPARRSARVQQEGDVLGPAVGSGRAGRAVAGEARGSRGRANVDDRELARRGTGSAS